jgi:hypothetical protein
MQELLKLKEEGKLNEAQKQWFRNEKPKEELFDCVNDPHELNNLAEKPEYKEKLSELSEEMDRWLNEIGDNPSLPEIDLVKKLWNGETKKPVTAKPIAKLVNGKIEITCSTKGASIGYKTNAKANSWKIYSKPLELQNTEKLIFKAHRIGFKPSETLTLNSSTIN